MLTRWNPNGSWIAPWVGDPWDESIFGELRRRMDRMFEELDHGAYPAFGAGLSAPVFELHDRGEALEVRALLPGFRREDVEVQVERNTLTIRGRRRTEVPEGYLAHRRERGAMEVARAFTLPCRVDPERAQAALKNGVLTLSLPKVPEEQPRRIDVRVS